MSFEHLRFRRRVALLALGALEGLEAEAVSAHADGCSRCRRELDGVRVLLDGMAADPVARVEPALSCEALVARVQARLEEELAPRVSARWRLVALPLAAAALIATVLLLPRLTGPPSVSSPTVANGAPQSVSVPEELLARMERRLARERTARYLNEAQDVLMTVASLHRHCLNEDENRAVDVQDDVQRSRDLLVRRVLLLDAAGREVAMAEPLLADVEELLRQVADLPSCARSQDLRAINRRMTEGRLLMKIDLMARELQG